MDRLKQLMREPALLIDLGETLVIFIVAFGVGLSGDQQSYLVAAVIAVVGLLKAFSTRPFAVSALTDATRAILVVIASFGVGLTADQIAISATLVGTVTTLIMRAQITPRSSPVSTPDGAGAGPVRGEAGEIQGLLGALVVLAIAVAVIVLIF